MASVTKRGKKWFAQVRKAGKPSQSKSFDSKAKAVAWAAQMHSQLDCNASAPLGLHVTSSALADLIERYISTVSRHKRGIDAETYRLNKIARHPIAQKCIKKLTPTDIADYRDDRLRDVKPSTVHKELALIHSIIQTAQNEWGVFLAFNPVTKVRRPQFQDGRQRRISSSEVDALRKSLASCLSPMPLLIFELALATAMRRGEILALKWQHVNLQMRTAHLPNTKNGDNRDIPLSDQALRVLEASKAHSAQDEHVFPIELEAFKSAWQRAMARTGITNLRFHDLRHEAISRFFEVGLSLPEVAVISGHRDPRMLLRYTHIPASAIALKLERLRSA
ncbi:MAG: tyrosine-type recombinase/integrase [Sphingomonadales bacterium]|jgi:integrase